MVLENFSWGLGKSWKIPGFLSVKECEPCVVPPALRDIHHTPMAWYSLLVLKVPLNTKQTKTIISTLCSFHMIDLCLIDRLFSRVINNECMSRHACRKYRPSLCSRIRAVACDCVTQGSHASWKVLDFSWKFQDMESPGKSLWSWKLLEIKA